MTRRVRWNLKLVLGSLAVSALVLPFCVAFLVSLAIPAKFHEETQLRLRLVGTELAMAVRRDRSGRMLVREDYRPPRGFTLVLADPRGSVLYSSAASFARGSKIDMASAAAAAGAELGSAGFFAEKVESGGAVIGSYYIWMPSNMEVFASSASRPVTISLIILGLIVVVFPLGVLVATKLARAVFKLEKAAGRIAAGDFRTAVRVAGIREIEDLAAAMDGMRVALLEDRDRRARFLAAVSHDLRTPLTSIGGYLEAVSDGLASDPEILDKYVRIMRGKARLLETRIGGLIDFARMETEEWRMGFESVDLGQFLEGLAREAFEDAALMGRRFESELGAIGALALPIDKILLSRAVENVVSNALRFAPEGGLVRMSARRSSGTIVVDVDDDGPGIPPPERERVFEPFYRGSSAREGEGSGLGLYIARSIVRGHGWELEAAESPLGGGRVSIVVPEPR